MVLGLQIDLFECCNNGAVVVLDVVVEHFVAVQRIPLFQIGCFGCCCPTALVVVVVVFVEIVVEIALVALDALVEIALAVGVALVVFALVVELV